MRYAHSVAIAEAHTNDVESPRNRWGCTLLKGRRSGHWQRRRLRARRPTQQNSLHHGRNLCTSRRWYYVSVKLDGMRLARLELSDREPGK